MKVLLTCILSILLLISSVDAGTKEFRYNDFGPQIAVHKLIGFGWFQWDSHGDSDPRSDSRIKVIIFWNEELENVKAQFPVNQSKLVDYRYLELGRAIQHLQDLIPNFGSTNLSTKNLESTLKALTEIQNSESGPRD